MGYYLEFYDKNKKYLGNTSSFSDLQCDIEINNIGTLQFTIPKGEEIRERGYLDTMNIIKLYRDGKFIWDGRIYNDEPNDGAITLTARDGLADMEYRTITGKWDNINLGMLATQLIQHANAKEQTMIENIDRHSNLVGSFEFVDMSVYSCLKELADAGLEFYYYNGTFIARDIMGEIKSNGFYYDDTYGVGNNITRLELSREADIVNYCIGKGRDDLRTTAQSHESRIKYGYKERVVIFESCNDMASLQLATDKYLEEHKTPRIYARFQPIVKAVGDWEGYRLGDFCPSNIRKGYLVFNELLRITGITRSANDGSSMPNISFTIADSTKQEQTIFSDMENMRRAIDKLQSKVF